jgi:hypothetical protein
MMEFDLPWFYQELSLGADKFGSHFLQTAYQASGPGGQKRNRVYSGVRLKHCQLPVTATAAEFREVHKNVAMAILRLRLQLVFFLFSADNKEMAAVMAESLPKAEELARVRVGASDQHWDYPFTLLLVLHLLLYFKGHISEVSALLKISTASVVKFLKKNKAAWQILQHYRQYFALPLLK